MIFQQRLHHSTHKPHGPDAACGRGIGDREGPASRSFCLPGWSTVMMGLAVLFCLLAVLVPAGPARAGCDGTDNDRYEANRVIRELASAEGEINTRIETLEANVVHTLKLHAGQTSASVTQNALALTQALDEQTRRQAQTAREVEETREIRGHAPSVSACESITGLAALPAVREGTGVSGAEAARREIGRLTQDRAVTNVPGAAADTRARFENVTAHYCNADRMGVSGEVCRGSDDDHDADLRPGALWDHPTLSGEDDRRTAADWIRNITVPMVQDPPPISGITSHEARRRYLSGRADTARGALALDYLNGLYARRTPAVGRGAWASAIGVDGGTDGRTGELISRHELLEVLAQRRFENPDYFISLQAQGTENLLRELITLQAVSLMIQWDRYNLEEQRGALTAAQLAMENDRYREQLRRSDSASGN